MHSSALHDPRTTATPSQRLAWAARSALRASIAAKAGALQPRRILTFEIPNTPFGVPKIPSPRIVVKREPPPVYRMWFEDLIAEAERILAMPAPLPPRPADVKQIQKAVAEHYGLSWEIMFSEVRRANWVRPRHLAMFLSKTMTTRSLPDIGRRFGGRDHSTIHNAIQKIKFLLTTDAAFAAEVETIKAVLQTRFA